MSNRLSVLAAAVLFSGMLSLAVLLPSPPPPVAQAWPEADALFRRQVDWLGGDVASSVDLGHGRTLWLFGDSFVATANPPRRDHAVLVRNSVAVQTGPNPAAAAIRFYWRTRRGKPEAFFPSRGQTWLWPTHGIRLDDKLLLFATRARPDPRPASLGFENYRWTAFLVANPDAEPPRWHMRELRAPQNPWRLFPGASLLLRDGYLYAFSPQEPTHDVFLARWTLAHAAAGKLDELEWWSGGEAGWQPQDALVASPEPVFRGGQMEFGVAEHPEAGGLVLVETLGFGAANVAFRRAPRPEGPWTEPVVLFRPPESDRPDTLIYAAKLHPHLEGAGLVVTYASNAVDFGTLVRDSSLYYPRFLTLRWSAKP